MDVQLELVILAMLLGRMIGLKRERSQKQADNRPFGAVAETACISISIARQLTDEKSVVAWIIAAFATGLDFISARLIFRDRNETMQRLNLHCGAVCHFLNRRRRIPSRHIHNDYLLITQHEFLPMVQAVDE